MKKAPPDNKQDLSFSPLEVKSVVQQLSQELKLPTVADFLVSPLSQLLNLFLPQSIKTEKSSQGQGIAIVINPYDIKLEIKKLDNTYQFSFFRQGGKDFSFPRLDRIKAIWNLDFEALLPAEITAIYNSLSISGIEFNYGTTESDLYTELKATKLSVFGLVIDEIIIPINIRFKVDKTQIFIAAIIKHRGLEIKGQLPSKLKDWKLSGEYKSPVSKNLTHVLEDFTGIQTPAWLKERFPAISTIKADIFPHAGTFEFILETGPKPWTLLNINQEPLISISDVKLQINRENGSTGKKIKIKLKGNINLKDQKIEFDLDNEKLSSMTIQGEIKKEFIQSLISQILSGEYKDASGVKESIMKILQDRITNLRFLVQFDRFEFSTDNFLINVYKHAEDKYEESKWHYLIDYHLSSLELPLDLHKKLPDFITEIIKDIDLRFVYSSREIKTPAYRRGLSTILKVPLHKIPLIKSIIKQETCFLPILISYNQKQIEIKSEPMTLVDEIDLGLGKLTHVSMGFKLNPPGFDIHAKLQMGIFNSNFAADGSLSVKIPNEIKGSFTIPTEFQVLGLLINKLSIGVEYKSSSLSASLGAQFQIAERKNLSGKETKGGDVQCGFGVAGITSFKAKFSKGLDLTITEFAKILIPPDKRENDKTLDVLKKIFPIALTPVNDEIFVNALKASTYDDLKELAIKNEGRILFSVDIQAISARISGQLNIADLFVAFIMLDLSLKRGLTLIGGVKPINLFDGLIQVKRSTQVDNSSEENKPPINIEGPVIYARIPGWESLFSSEGFNAFRIHANAFIQFFGMSIDAKLEINPSGLDVYFYTQLDFPLLLLNNLLRIQIDKKGFSFEMAAQLSLTIAALNWHMLTATAKFRVTYAAGISEQTAFQIKCDLLLKTSNTDKLFKFEYAIPRRDCQTISFLVDKLLSCLSDKVTSNKELSETKVTCITDDQTELYLNNLIRGLQDILFDSEIKISKPIQLRTTELCLLRCLLRINKSAQLLQAFKLISRIEKDNYKIESLIESKKSFLETAISRMENKPLISFCYFRILETDLKDSISAYENGLIKYYLGIMYVNHDVPMARKFTTRWDQKVDHYYKFNYYLSNKELLNTGLSLFIESFDILNKKSRLTRLPEPIQLFNLLPLYQLWLNIKSDYFYQRRIDKSLPDNLINFLFKSTKESSKESKDKSMGQIHHRSLESYEDNFLQMAFSEIALYLPKIKNTNKISNLDFEIIFILLIQIVIDRRINLDKYSELLSILYGLDFNSPILKAYKDFFRMAFHHNKSSELDEKPAKRNHGKCQNPFEII